MISVALKHRFETFSLDLSFQAGPGVTAFYGPSGTGKTSVLNAVAGILQPDEGRVIVQGRVLLDTQTGVSLPPHKRRVGYVFQDARLFAHLDIRANLTYPCRFSRHTGDLDRIVSMLGLEPLLQRRTARLSGGEAQRVAIGRALMAAPDILLLDEPLAALDPARKAEILPYLEGLRDQADLPIFDVSHAMSEVARLATTLVLMQNGRVVRHGPVADVLSDPDAVQDLGVRAAGALIEAVVSRQDAGDGLSKLRISGGDIYLPQVAHRDGTRLRLRIAAGDVILARDKPDGLSALNILPVTIRAVREGRGPGVAVALDCGEDKLIERVTARSARLMKLAPRQSCFAVIKSVSIAPVDVGGRLLPVTRDVAEPDGMP